MKLLHMFRVTHVLRAVLDVGFDGDIHFQI